MRGEETRGLLATYFDENGRVLSVAAGSDAVGLETAGPRGTATVRARGILVPPVVGEYSILTSPLTEAVVDGHRLGQSTLTRLELPRGGVDLDVLHRVGGSDPLAWSGPGVTGTVEIASVDLRSHSVNTAEKTDAFPTGATASTLWGDADADDDVDSDYDGIPNALEVDGYTVEQSATGVISVVAWTPDKHDGASDACGRPYHRFVTSPLKASTSGDPYTDFQKATGVQMDPRVANLAQHPLVTAYPDVAIDMARYRLIANTQWSSSEGGSNQKGVTQSTSSSGSSSDTVGGEASCSASLLDFGCSVSVNYSTTTETSTGYEDSTSNSTSAEWNALLSGDDSKAAIMLPNIFYENVGTAPVSNGYPLFTVKLGDESLVSATSNAANRLTAANPGETYPRGDTALAFEKVNDFDSVIGFDRDAVDRLRDYAVRGADDLEIVTTGLDAPVMLIDTEGQSYPSSTSWEEQLSLIRATTAELVVEGADGQPTGRRVAAPGTSTVERTVPQLTVGQALELSHGAKKVGSRYEVAGIPITPETHDIITDPATAEAIRAQGVESIFDAKLTAGMSITVNVVTPDPVEPEKPAATVRQLSYTGRDHTGCEPGNPACTLQIMFPQSDETCSADGDDDIDDEWVVGWTVQVAGHPESTPYCFPRSDYWSTFLFTASSSLAGRPGIPEGTEIVLKKDGVEYGTLTAPAPEAWDGQGLPVR